MLTHFTQQSRFIHIVLQLAFLTEQHILVVISYQHRKSNFILSTICTLFLTKGH